MNKYCVSLNEETILLAKTLSKAFSGTENVSEGLRIAVRLATGTNAQVKNKTLISKGNNDE